MVGEDAGTAPSFLAQATTAAQTILGEIEERTSAFAAQSGIRCREGCGQCCLKPGIEAQVVELLPLAAHLLATGAADAAYERAAAAPDGICAFYAPAASDATLGRCTVYAQRPSLCRLFGFAAVSNKHGGRPELASCHWHKKLQPDTVTQAQAAIDGGAEVPLFLDYSVRFQMIAPGSGLEELLPINRAVMRAIEKLALTGSSGTGAP